MTKESDIFSNEVLLQVMVGTKNNYNQMNCLVDLLNLLTNN